MLADVCKIPFNDPEWIIEIKVDGWRAIAEVNNANDIKLYSRSGTSFLKAFPHVHEALKEINLPVVLDGEIVALKNGKVSFQSLQNHGNNSNTKIQFYVFDCLSMNGIDLRGLPLVQRKELLQQLIGDSTGVIKYVDHHSGTEALSLFDHAKKMNLEGIIAKKANSKYIHDRSKYWLKIKNKLREEFVIVGMIDGEGSRQYFGGLVLAEKQGKKFLYRGHVGSGFTDKQLKQTYDLLIKHKIDLSVVETIPVKFKNPVTWLKPKYYCQVEFTELTDEEVLRHPVFLGLRVDKEIE
jgi:bifunctional non-homologous end joining protein LigD